MTICWTPEVDGMFDSLPALNRCSVGWVCGPSVGRKVLPTSSVKCSDPWMLCLLCLLCLLCSLCLLCLLCVLCVLCLLCMLFHTACFACFACSVAWVLSRVGARGDEYVPFAACLLAPCLRGGHTWCSFVAFLSFPPPLLDHSLPLLLHACVWLCVAVCGHSLSRMGSSTRWRRETGGTRRQPRRRA